MTKHRGFLDLEQVLVPRSLADYANAHLREVGRAGNEGFALWAGRAEGQTFQVLETIIPAQTAIRSQNGVCVGVDADELFRLNVHLYSRELKLVAQLHSHPGAAYHSDTDDQYPIATTAGALSIVVPDFAAGPFSLDNCAVYRLDPAAGWIGLSPSMARSFVQILEDQ